MLEFIKKNKITQHYRYFNYNSIVYVPKMCSAFNGKNILFLDFHRFFETGVFI